MRNIRSFLIISLVFCAFVDMFAQETVNDRELLEHQGPVEFINNTDAPARIDSRAAIWGIGNALGRSVNSGSNHAGQTGRYFVIHCVSPEETGKFDADIFGLGPNAGVDHIRNVRLIIQGYLEAAYHYSPDDAALLAQYITIYNAVFRKNAEYFNANYNEIVTANLVEEKIGLPVRYNEWPGQTLIVIPLGNAQADSLSAINTTPLAAPEVVEEQRKEQDMGIEARQDMVDLKEREAEEAEQRAQAQEESAAQEREAIEQEREAIEREREQIAQEAAVASAGESVAAEEAAASEDGEGSTQRKQELAQRERELAQREEAAAQMEEAAQRNQEFAEQKTAEAQQERQEIAQDQQELANNERQESQSVSLGVVLSAESSPLGKIVQIDAATGELIKDSEDSSLNIRTVVIVNDAIFALSAQGDSRSYRLVKIAIDTLETAAWGADAISVNSLLWVNGTDLYAIGATDAGFYMARFDANLKLQAASPVAVHPFASAMFYQDRLLTEGADGGSLFLNPQTLEEHPWSAQ
ncbi:MAG: hypothetical protein LBG43_05830 [Treponema sp.]|jgi:hypothetical protein|nr:hypothetical protein [Treponema sp.]